MKHLTTQEILHAARMQSRLPHMDECAFCSEHYSLAIGFLQFDPPAHARGDDLQNGILEYRLAAQTDEVGTQLFRLRRTWYLDQDASIIRVVEDIQRKTLTGFLITEEHPSTILVRFEEMGKEFSPDDQGMFEIGPSQTQVETMHVLLLKAG